MPNNENKANEQKHSKLQRKSSSPTRAKKQFVTTEVIPLPPPDLTEQEVKDLKYLPTSVGDVLHSAKSFALEYRPDGEELLTMIKEEIILGDLWHGDQKHRLFCFFKDMEDLIVKTCHAYGELDVVTDDEATIFYYLNY